MRGSALATAALGVALAAAAPAGAVEKCKVAADKRTGVLRVPRDRRLLRALVRAPVASGR